MGSGDAIEEGDEVRERQDIATIPRAGGMTVKASIHETKLKKIQVGQPCLVTVDAFPGRTFEGRVDFVAVMADSGSWRSNPNQRLYKADISLLAPTTEMRPGMSCSVEILVEDLEDVHYVPRQSVFMDGGDTVAFTIDGGEVKAPRSRSASTTPSGSRSSTVWSKGRPWPSRRLPISSRRRSPRRERPASFRKGGLPSGAGRSGQELAPARADGLRGSAAPAAAPVPRARRAAAAGPARVRPAVAVPRRSRSPRATRSDRAREPDRGGSVRRARRARARGGPRGDHPRVPHGR